MAINNSALQKAYAASEHEASVYAAWEESGFFSPEHLPGERTEQYSIMMPPPNVTGVLHLGHALEQTILDAKVRFERMRGKRALLVPGTDHAAVATQARVEKDLIAKGHLHPREEFGREKLLEIIREYADTSRETILSQIRKLGTSCDWSRLAYTFDEQRSRAVYEVFARMYEDGLIFRGYRVVNWSVKGQSTCSDDELVHVERDATLYTFTYSHDFPIPIATTRPETKLGDTAVAVHPDDARYAQYIGKVFTVSVGASDPLQIKVIGDKSVDPSFGTGALGVTPAHSMIDYEMKERHDLALVSVIGPDGRMTEAAGKYRGMSVEEARAGFVQWLRDQKLLIKEEDIKQNVATSDRFGDVIEVIPMLQWFVGVNRPIPSKQGKTLKDLMREAGSLIDIQPARFADVYLRWIDSLRDWCISRQIWWGHRIPVWYCACGEIVVSILHPIKGCGACGKNEYRPEEDTLDTWFSSGTWTFSTLGWPDSTDDLKQFHPTAWMQMGYELVFFWMARMILMSRYALDQIPFRQVYIHGLLRDKEGKKFSKSLRNTIDPLEMSAKYGTDALRMSMVSGVTPGNDVTFYEEKVLHHQHFVNKVWNIARFILGTIDTVSSNSDVPQTETDADRWILGELQKLTTMVTESLDRSDFSMAAQSLYQFTWSTFADWYLEIAKIEGRRSPESKKCKDAILFFVLRRLLTLMHPFMPFVTEVIWKQLGSDHLLMVENWPSMSLPVSSEAEGTLLWVREKITEIRESRSTRKIAPAQIVSVHMRLEYPAYRDVIEKLARCTIVETDELQVRVESEITLTEAKKKELQQYIFSLEKKLGNQAFVKNAPADVVTEERRKLAEAQAKLGG